MTEKIFVLLGPPGSGKGTQGPLLEERFQIPHLSTGHILRTEKEKESELGKLANSYLSKGKLVPDKVMNDLIYQIIQEPQLNQGFILDGYPRTLEQAQHLYQILANKGSQIATAIEYTLPDEIVVQRIHGRALQMQAKGVKPRPDDLDKEVIRDRLETYHRNAKPIVRYYEHQGILVNVDATPDKETIFQETIKLLKD